MRNVSETYDKIRQNSASSNNAHHNMRGKIVSNSLSTFVEFSRIPVLPVIRDAEFFQNLKNGSYVNLSSKPGLLVQEAEDALRRGRLQVHLGRNRLEERVLERDRRAG